jgi:hypothetical protein
MYYQKSIEQITQERIEKVCHDALIQHLSRQRVEKVCNAAIATSRIHLTCPVKLRAEMAVGVATSEGGVIPPFEMVAYTGGLLRVAGFSLPVVVDLSGLTGTEKPLPILLDHDKSQRVGHADRILNDGQSLKAAGLISGSGAAAEEVRQNVRKKFPWQASIGAEILEAREYGPGEVVAANGRTFTGPVILATRSRLREISFVAVGADDQTSVRVAAQARADHRTVSIRPPARPLPRPTPNPKPMPPPRPPGWKLLAGRLVDAQGNRL